MEKRWIYKDKGNPNTISHLAEVLGIEPVLATLLVQRGISTFDEAKKFFRPSLDDLYNPYLMKDMQQAVERIERAIRSNERILVYGDYDVDGTTAVALIYSFFLKRFTKTNIKSRLILSANCIINSQICTFLFIYKKSQPNTCIWFKTFAFNNF